MEGTIGEIRLFAATFAPKSWAYCNGQTINIASNTALFSILGIVYGGNGTTTFQLPNLQGRTVVGVGQGPGLSPYTLGQADGAESEVMSIAEMPMHTHIIGGGIVISPIAIPATNDTATTTEPASGSYPAITDSVSIYEGTGNSFMAPLQTTLTVSNVTVGNTGGGVPFSKISPIVGMNYIICQYGIYPARN